MKCINIIMGDKSEIFKQNWECEKHPGCIFSIPCDCNNCKKFEYELDQRKYERTNQTRYKKSPRRIEK